MPADVIAGYGGDSVTYRLRLTVYYLEEFPDNPGFSYLIGLFGEGFRTE